MIYCCKYKHEPYKKRLVRTWNQMQYFRWCTIITRTESFFRQPEFFYIEECEKEVYGVARTLWEKKTTNF